jgi:protease IV
MISEHDSTPSPSVSPVGQTWERGVLEKLAFQQLAEMRTARRWRNFFRLAWLTFFALLFATFMGWIGRGGPTKEKGAVPVGESHTAIVDIAGVIAPGTPINAERINNALQNAFDDRRTAGVILRINSPGGSPVQAGMVVDEVRRLKAKRPEIRVYAVIEDICASGGYYIASAADEIFVDKASIVGSIGVIMDGFGAVGAMEKLGIERRALAAGDNKSFLDPFSPVNPAHVEHARKLLSDVHQQFIDTVRQGRGKRLKETADMFSGLVWTGRESIQLGLADKFGSVESVARDVIKAETLLDYTIQENYWDRVSRRFGVAIGDTVGQGVLRALTDRQPGLR